MSLPISRLGHILLIKGSEKGLVFRREIESCRPFLDQPGKGSLVIFFSSFRDPFDGLPHLLPFRLNGSHSEILLFHSFKYGCVSEPIDGRSVPSRRARSDILPVQAIGRFFASEADQEVFRGLEPHFGPRLNGGAPDMRK